MATGQVNMRDARVDDVDHVSDSDNDDKEEPGSNNESIDAFTVGIFPSYQSPIYLHLGTKQEKVNIVLFDFFFPIPYNTDWYHHIKYVLGFFSIISSNNDDSIVWMFFLL